MRTKQNEKETTSSEQKRRAVRVKEKKNDKLMQNLLVFNNFSLAKYTKQQLHRQTHSQNTTQQKV